MTQLVKMKAGETTFWIEPDEEAVTVAGPKMVSALGKSMEVSIDSFVAPVREICQAFTTLMKTDIPKPNKFTIEFGFKVSGEGNIILVKTGTEASLTITAEWDTKSES
jgi:inner membrane protein involved in colicin E2 resistance